MSSNKNGNAFAIIMSNRRHTKKSNNGRHLKCTKISNDASSPSASYEGSRFTLCPMGCGRNIARLALSFHMDRCNSSAIEGENHLKQQQQSSDMLMTTTTSSAKHVAYKKSAASKLVSDISNDVILEDSLDVRKRVNEVGNIDYEAEDQQRGQKKQYCHSEGNSKRGETKTTDNAFGHLMRHAQNFYSKNDERDEPSITHKFHLHDNDGKLSWGVVSKKDKREVEDTTLFLNENEINQNHSSSADDELNKSLDAWSASIVIRNNRGEEDSQKTSSLLDTENRDIKVIISSSVPKICRDVIPNRPSLPRLVERPSKLSVPVLKSILQKSIRRRRPLPAVRVAMELADKSWGDFIRRLPIIILEDSILHHNFPLLIWLMVADSKDFFPPLPLVIQVMQIVFEVASCPWKDNIDSIVHSHRKITSPCNVRLIFQPDYLSRIFHDEKCGLLLKSMVLRKQYGGMACDMKMLDEYIHTWGERFQLDSVPTNITNVLFPKQRTNTNIKWGAIPQLLHASIRLENSSQLIPPMITRNKEGLTVVLKMSDITPSGIDFHCCNVLESILSDRIMYSNICEKVKKLELNDNGMIYADETKLREYALNCLKKCMWRFSSSINNRRLIFAGTADDVVRREVLLYNLWEMVLPSINAYASRYLAKRLVQ